MGVYRICKTAFDKAIQEHCPGACGVKEKSHPTHKAANHCAQHKETVPKPDAWEACRQGYSHGDRAATEFARSVKALHEESKDELCVACFAHWAWRVVARAARQRHRPPTPTPTPTSPRASLSLSIKHPTTRSTQHINSTYATKPSRRPSREARKGGIPLPQSHSPFIHENENQYNIQ